MPTDQDVLKADIVAAFQGAGGQISMTEGEAAQAVKKYYEDRGVWWDASEVEKQAATISAANGMAAMSVLKDGREVLTTEGQKAVFNGLRKGTVQLGDSSLNGVYILKDQRDVIRDELIEDITKEGVAMGLTTDQATWRMRRIMFGVNAVAGAPTLNDLLYTDKIPYSDKMEYNQLNTTYTPGPNGLPMATGFHREGFFGAIGLRPINKVWTPEETGMGGDSRMNSVDEVVGINLGMRALEARPESWEIPSIEQITKEGLEAVERAINNLDLTPPAPYQNKPGTGYGYGGWKNYGGYGGYGGYKRRHYGGGGYSSGGHNYFTRMFALPGMNLPYGNNIPFINTSNPIIRRADIRRERVWSERGRLKQWQ
jgi:hypothetical protein